MPSVFYQFYFFHLFILGDHPGTYSELNSTLLFLLFLLIPFRHVGRGGLGEKFSPGIFSPDQPTTLLALGVGGDEREEPISE